MKNLFKYIVPAALLVISASCVKESGADTIPANTRKYSITIDQPTRTELSGSGSTRSVSWSEGDAIKYYTESGQASAVSASVKIDGCNASVEVPRGRADEFINAVYGATQLKSSTSTENTMYVSSPVKNNQQYTSFAKVHLCAAFSDDLENPELKFHNAAAVLKFTSTGTIHKVVLYGNNNEVITGGSNGDLKIAYADGAVTTTVASTGGTSVTVQTNGAESDFYIAVLPVTFAKGITVDCYDEILDLVVCQKTTATINTLSDSGTPRVINLGSVQDWTSNPQPIAVNLGLSVKWATMNVGATKPEEYGDYFAWGETELKDEYKWANYSYGTAKNGPFSEYVLDANYGTVDHKTILSLEDDAAYAAWGDDWRMPSQEEFEELKKNCTWTWTTKNGVKGYRVTSKVSGYTGNSIFLPANGMYNGSSLTSGGTEGNYWTASLSGDHAYHSISPYFGSSSVSIDNCYRYFGLGVRPVQGAIVPVESIDISAELELLIGKTATLSATVFPSNATYKSLTWASSDESVATVDATGKVTAVSAGNATITVYSADASKTATCNVSVIEPPQPEAGLEAYNKWLGEWNVTRQSLTDKWVISENVPGASFYIQGIDGGNSTIADILVEADYDSANDAIVLYTQDCKEWTYGGKTYTIGLLGLFNGTNLVSGDCELGTITRTGENEATITSGGSQVTLDSGTYDVSGMKFFAYDSTGNGYVFNSQIFYQWPETMDKIVAIDDDPVYNAFLGSWNIKRNDSEWGTTTNKYIQKGEVSDTWTITPKVAGFTFYISGIEGYDDLEVVADYDKASGTFSISEQDVVIEGYTYGFVGLFYYPGSSVEPAGTYLWDGGARLFTAKQDGDVIALTAGNAGSYGSFLGMQTFQKYNGSYYDLHEEGYVLPNTLTKAPSSGAPRKVAKAGGKRGTSLFVGKSPEVHRMSAPARGYY